MLYDQDEDLVAIREGVRAVCKQFPDEYWRARDEDGNFPEEFHRAMAEGGWLGITMPEEFGGQNLGVSEAAMMMHTASGEQGAIKVRTILKERGLEDQIKLAVGGAPYKFDPELYKKVGADGWAENGLAAATILRGLIGEVSDA